MPNKLDVRIPFAALLGSYVILGLTVLGFNRSPGQALLTILAAIGFDFAANTWIRKRKPSFPFSGLITGCGLCLLLNYGSHPWLPILPAFLAIASKHIFTLDGRHFFNPALFGLFIGGFASQGMLSPAPAYQWHGSLALTFILIGLAFFIFVFRIGRGVLVGSFLGFYGLQMLLRAWLMKHHVPPEAVILGTLSSPPFFLFTFYMLTDPMTSPKSWKAQIALAAGVTALDFFLHFKHSYSTLFPALFMIQAATLVFQLLRNPKSLGSAFAGWWKQALGLGVATAGLIFLFQQPQTSEDANGVRFTAITPAESGIGSEMSAVLGEIDPRIRHIAKWILSVGDAVAVADVDNDGLVDLFLTQPLKRPEDRAVLYRNLGEFRFEKIRTPVLDAWRQHPERHGFPSSAVFADYDNDGDQDLFVGGGFGQSRLFRNLLSENGTVAFEDVSEQAGLAGVHTACISATFLDWNQDGNLDLLVGNAMAPYLPDYESPTKLDIFNLPQPEYEGDRRMFHFMHASWHQAINGGKNIALQNQGDGTFREVDLNMPETHWTLALNAADLNQDGWPDLYAASDFGPDDAYFNEAGKSFTRQQGKVFGSIGKDTYKGMNCSIADFDRNGWLDVHVSNVHAPLQAEGSLLWMMPGFHNQAAKRGALNPHRFGWGAAVADLDLNGWPDMVQANGMVDDSIDHKFEEPRDYWYVNSRLARTGPEVHAYADKWGDIRGYTIWGHQQNRVLLNQGGNFRDIANVSGLSAKGNSRGVATADFDNDGDADLLITHQFKAPSLFRNELAVSERAWVGLKLKGDGDEVNRDAVNVKIWVTQDGISQYAEVLSVSGFSAQSDHRAVFGLKSEEVPFSVEVEWKAGIREKFDDLAPNQYHQISQ